METSRYKESIERDVQRLVQMRDELRLQLHLAKADARDEWDRLEKSWHELEAELRRFRSEAREPIAQLSASTQTLLSNLKDSYERMKNQMKAS